MERRYIYVVVSHTPTTIGKLIRIFGDISYNHSAIALDDNFKEIYAFDRPQYHGILHAKLVKESYTSYTLNTDEPVPVKVFKIEVSKDEYDYIKTTIHQIKEDKDFHYNVLSLITHPILKGWPVYKTYTCSEFVAHILEDIGYRLPQPSYNAKPEHLVDLLDEHLMFEGDIRNILDSNNIDAHFFDTPSLKYRIKGLRILFIVLMRGIIYTRLSLIKTKMRQG